MAATDKDVEMLRQKLEALTEAGNTNPPGEPLKIFFSRMQAAELVMLLSEISATTRMDQRMRSITKVVMPESVRITEKTESLLETISVAELAVSLAYDREFTSGAGRSPGGLQEVLKKMVATKSGMSQPKAGYIV